MKLDDRFMTILTALVLFIGIGALLSRGEDGESFLGSSDNYEAKPDTFTLRAGRMQSLDVLLNDRNTDKIQPTDLAIVQPPKCGLAEAVAGTIQYSNSATCDGALVLSYCVPFEDECEATAVTLNVINVDQQRKEQIASASSGSSGSTSGDGSAPSIMTDIVQASAPDASPQFAMQRPVRLEMPSTAEVVTPSEATESIRNRDVAVAVNVQSNDITNITSSGVNVSQTSARAGNVATGGISMSAPSPTGESSGIAIASADTTPARTPARSASPSGLQPSITAPQVDTPAINTATAAPQPKPAPAPATQTASLPQITAPAEPAQSAPSAQTRVAEAPETPQAPQEAPANSGVFASLARSSSVLGLTVSAAKSLLSPEEEAVVTVVSPRNTASAPRPSNFAVNDGLANQAPQIENLESAIPLPQSDTPVATAGPAPALVASLQSDDSTDFASLSTPAAPPAPQAAELPKVAEPAPVKPVQPEAPTEQVAALTPEVDQPAFEIIKPAEAPAIARDCAVDMALQVQSGAEIVASVLSPCRPNELFEVSHAGMQFSATTDAEGMANVIVPAMVPDATVAISFADGAGEEGNISVNDLEKVTRVAVTWEADINFDLHALEFGAQDGSEGHVWAEQPRDYRKARRAGGGYITTLGPETGPGLRAEVYTLFQTSRTKDGLVDLSLKLAAFGEECNDAPVIRTLRTEGLDIERDRDIQFSLSGCENASEIVVPNTIRDIRVSRR